MVGGGPSLKDTIQELKNFNTIMVCGSSYDYVAENINNLIDYAVICDPDDIVIKYMQKARIETQYFVASQCDPKVFQYLKEKDAEIFIWNSAGEDEFNGRMFSSDQFLCGGGCTVGTRAIYLAMGLGYSDIHLFGFDTCIVGNDYKHHAYEFATEEETIGDIKEVALGGPDGKKFKVAGYMLGQLHDFQKMLQFYPGRLNFTIHGEGLLKHLIELSQKKVIEDGK